MAPVTRPSRPRPALASGRNQTQKSGVTVQDRNQLASSVRMITWASARRNSPVVSGASISGRKASMVVSDDVSSGTASVRLAASAASRRAAPSSMRFLMSSAITTPLSTSRPSAMMMAAMETRCSGIPHSSMPTSDSRIVSGTMVPTMAPARRPRNSITTASTVSSVWHRLLVASATAAATMGGWSVTTASDMPSGSSARNRSSAARVSAPKSLIATFGTIDSASTTAGSPLNSAGRRGGST